MSVHYGIATTAEDFRQILSLQQANLASTLSNTQADRDGFVTVKHSLELLNKMNDSAPQVIAKAGDKVIGYALVMLKSFGNLIPVLQPMVDRLGTIEYGNKKITEYPFYIMGQICVDEQFRGQGIFDSLYGKHKELYQSHFALCVTSVAERNKRSMRAHERVGFTTVHTFQDTTDKWNILVWQWNT
jgi:ribosomal protein S18 acetylase RimI-like enzyme